MDFESLDGYLLDRTPAKAEVVRELLAERPRADAASAFYEGLQRLGARTPDLALIALRLVLGGRKADDEAVMAVRTLLERSRSGDPSARDEYFALVRGIR